MAPWDLTDAIDAGDTAAALGALRRLFGAGGVPSRCRSWPILHRHYQAMLRLDGVRRDDARRGRGAPRHAQRLPGPQGTRAGPPAGPGAASAGR